MTEMQARVVIHPFNLTKDINKHIISHIERNCCGTLSKEGYIKNIKHISRVREGKITPSSNGSVVYQVDYEADVYKLERGQTVKAIVKAITNFGIYCDDWDAPKGVSVFFVPKHELDESEELKDNDVIFLKIEDLRIKKNEYLCVCSKSHSELYSPM